MEIRQGDVVKKIRIKIGDIIMYQDIDDTGTFEELLNILR